MNIKLEISEVKVGDVEYSFSYQVFIAGEEVMAGTHHSTEGYHPWNKDEFKKYLKDTLAYDIIIQKALEEGVFVEGKEE